MPEVQFKRATDFIDNQELAKAYVKQRAADVDKFMATIQRWEACNEGRAVRTVLYGNIVVHELAPSTLHASRCWGELHYTSKEEGTPDPETFWSFEQFAAFMLATYW
jgi:hypothetical protein